MSEKTEKKQRLLIVDDSKVIRVTARKILQGHFETIEAVDGEEAWNLLSQEDPVTLVVSDLTMPGLNGFELLERIRKSHLPHVRDLPVIIITGANDTEATMECARKAGATDFIGKPFDAVHLLARTQAHASSHAVNNTLKQENTALEDQAAVDPLTRLASEVAFMERGYQQLSYAIRHNSNLALYRIEIDDFSAISGQRDDSLTEAILRELATILDSVTRQEDTVARIGTARFALLLPGTDNNGVRLLARRISQEVSKRSFSSGDGPLGISVSIGIAAPAIRRDTRLDELLALADHHLSQAIAMGGNRFICDGDSEAIEESESVTAPAPEMNIQATADLIGARPVSGAFGLPALEDETVDVEEIEISTPGLPYDNRANGRHHGPGAECRHHASPEPPLNTFAGPVPDHVADITIHDASPAETFQTAAAPVEPSPVSPANRSGADTDTPPAPGTMEAVADAVTETGRTPPPGTGNVAIVPGQAGEREKDIHASQEAAVRRKGFLKRTLALFGRRGSRR